PIFATRFKCMIAEENPALAAVDENLLSGKLAYQERDLEEELAIVERTRSQMARILRTLKPDVLQRTSVHSQRGPRTLEQMLTGAINHISHHVPFIVDKRKALGLPA